MPVKLRLQEGQQNKTLKSFFHSVALTISLYQPVSVVYKSIIYALVKFPNSLQVVIKNLF